MLLFIYSLPPSRGGGSVCAEFPPFLSWVTSLNHHNFQLSFRRYERSPSYSSRFGCVLGCPRNLAASFADHFFRIKQNFEAALCERKRNAYYDHKIDEGSESFPVMPAPGGHPASLVKNFWIPAFAAMTGLQEKNSPNA
jgi:hypothetical protein